MTRRDEPAVKATSRRPTRDVASRRVRRIGQALPEAPGIGLVAVHGIAGGRHTATTVTAAARPSTGGVGRDRVDAGGTRLRLRALHAMGHGSARIARAAGASEQAIQKITRGQTATVRPALRDAVAAVYEAWWDKRPPERTRYQRAAATLARRRAMAGNWCAAAGLDDDQLDAPGYQPAWGWLPATGTGTATGLLTPARQTGIA